MTGADIASGAISSLLIQNGSILFADLNQNGCTSGEIIKWNGSAWICGTDNAGAGGFSFVVSDGSNTQTVADSDTVTFAAGAGLSVLVSSTDTVTFSSLLGTTVDGSEIVDGSVGNVDLANSSLTVTAGTGLTGGGAVSLGGTVTLNAALGADVDSSEIVNGTILFADLNQNGCSTNAIIKWNGSAWACATDEVNDADASATNELQNIFSTVAASTGTNSVADSTTDTLTLAAGSGVTVTSDSTTDTITFAAVLGTTVDGSEIVDGSVGNVDLANSSLTVTAGTGLTGGGAVSLGGTVTLNAALGTTVESGEITNSTILFEDIAQNSCGTNDVIKWNGTAWACATDNSGTSGNSFETIVAPSGTNPVADSSTDSLTFADGAGITITGNGTTDTITIAAVLGSTIEGTEITDGTIGNVDLANSSLTVAAGSGLTNGGSVALGATTTLNIGAGNGITVNADDIAVRVAASGDALSSTTSSGSGLEVLGSGLTLLQGCTNGQLLKWDETTDTWGCANDSGAGVGADTLDYTDFMDTLSLDASTTTTLGSFNKTFNLNGTGEFYIQDGGTTVLSILSNGTFQFRNSADNTTSFLIQNSVGTELFVIDTTNNRVYIGDPTADTTGTLLVLDTKSDAGDPTTAVNGAMYYNANKQKFRCYENGVWKDCIVSSRTGYFYRNEFLGATTDGDLAFANTGTASANSAGNVGSVAGRPGIMQHVLGTTTTGNARAVSTNAAAILLGNSSVFGYETSLRIPTLSTLAERFSYRTGFIDSGTAESVDGCFFRYSDNINAGNWQGVCRSNNAESVCDTTIPVVAGTWYRLNVSVNAAGTSADFSTDGTSRCTIASNIPTGAGRGRLSVRWVSSQLELLRALSMLTI